MLFGHIETQNNWLDGVSIWRNFTAYSTAVSINFTDGR